MITAGAERRKTFKKDVTLEDSRRSREETAVRIRKNKKEEQMAKRRMMGTQQSQLISNGTTMENTKPTTRVTEDMNEQIHGIMEVLNQCMANPTFVSSDEVLDATKSLRRLLSIDRNPPVNEILAAGALPVLTKLLEYDDCPLLQFETTWALTNIASTNRAKDVVKSGAVPQLIRLLANSNVPNVRDQSIWCIGNIAGDCNEYRDGLLSTPGLAEGMIHNLAAPANFSILRNCAWAISNLVRGKPSPPLETVRQFIGPLANILCKCDNPSLQEENTMELRVDLAWAMSYLSDGHNDRIQAVIDSGVLPELIAFLGRFPKNRELLIPTVRALGNFVSGNEKQTQAVIDAGLLSHVSKLQNNPSKSIRKDTCWALSNIAAGTTVQVGAFLAAERGCGLLEKVVDQAIDASYDIRKEAVWTICNVVTNGNDRHLQSLVQVGGIRALCEGLKIAQDTKLLLVVMEAIEKMLEVDEEHDRNYSLILDEYGGIDQLEALQNHPNDDVYEASSGIIHRFFGADDDYDENIVPHEDDDTFGFGLPSKELFPEGVVSPSQPTFNFGGRLLNEHVGEQSGV